jgi:DNA-binding CsgD family transcriptional regulator/tetratricopeptide (TPR) repeat protein
VARRISSPVFVGRDDELERLGAMLASAMAGRPGSVVVAGEAGVGKTRLVAEFARAAHDGGARVLRGAAVPVGEGSLAYGPVVDALRALVRAPDRSPEGRLLGSLRRELAGLLPGLGPPQVRPTEASSLDAPSSPAAGLLGRERLLELLLVTLDRLSSDRPTVVVLEDLHWSDRASLDAVTFLHRNLRDQRVLLVLTHRSDDPLGRPELRTVLAELDRAGRTEWLELDRLDRDALHRMVAGILGDEPDAESVARIHERTGGNAYYAEELLALGSEDGTLPPTLRDVLLARIDGLDERGRSMLRVASAVGPRFDGGLVSLVDGLDREAALAALREAAARHIIVPVGGAGEAFEFRHALIAEAIYADLLPADRVRLHLAWARVLEARSSEQPERVLQAELARHWHQAGDLPRALTASVRAGLAARAGHSFADARTQLERALELWPRVPAAASLAGIDRPTLLEITAEVTHAAGAPAIAADHRRAAIALLDPSVDAVRVGLLEERLAFALLRAGQPEASRSARAAALRLVPDEPGSDARARVLAGWARELMSFGPLDDAADVARRAIEVARGAGAIDIEADALATLGATLGHIGELDDALATLERAQALAGQAGDLFVEGRARANRAAMFEGETCVREALAAAEWSDRVGLGQGDFPRCMAAAAMLELGRWDDAEQTLARVRSAGPEGTVAGYHRLVWAGLDLGRGRLAGAATAMERMWVDQSTLALTGHLAMLGLGAELALAQGRWVEARDTTRRAATMLTRWPLGVVVFNARIAWTALRAEADAAEAYRAGSRSATEPAAPSAVAVAVLELARSTAAAMIDSRAIHWRRPAAIAALCEAEWTRLEGCSDIDAWAAAVQACTKSGQHALRPYALLRQAEAVLVRGGGRRRVAGQLLREGRALAAAMGAAPLLADIDALARRARVDLGAVAEAPVLPEPSDPFGLTPREREVLTLVARGRTNREIARALFITEGTASVHVSNILGKLGVARRSEAAAVAVRLGLAD